jgi:hypothetical protein
MNTETLGAIAAELRFWQVDGRRHASDSLVRIAELLQDTGHLSGDWLDQIRARRNGRVLN